MTNPNALPDKDAVLLLLTFAKVEDAELFLTNSVVWLFRHMCQTRKFIDRPLIWQCDNCCRFNHTAKYCQSLPKCTICSGAHHTTDHVCEECGPSDILLTACDHKPFKCYNCGGDHPATHCQCPTRTRLQGTNMQPVPSAPQGSCKAPQKGKEKAAEQTPSSTQSPLPSQSADNRMELDAGLSTVHHNTHSQA
jgi:hypothetical protein